MKKFLAVIFSVILAVSCGFSQRIFRLYEGKAPGSEDWNYKEIEWTSPMMPGKMIRNVVDPALEVYMPAKSSATGTAVIVCPGGANIWLSWSNEGTDVAKWLADKGITAFVLKYRLNRTPEGEKEFMEFIPSYLKKIMSEKTPVPVPAEKYPGGEDGIRAVRYVREHAEEFGINPDKVGIMGFSAGAAVTIYTVINSSPSDQVNFAAPIYGGWLGDSKVPENAPPLFTLAAADDAISEACIELYKAWRVSSKPAEIHIYSKGGHGFGMTKRGLPVDEWIERFHDWLKASGF